MKKSPSLLLASLVAVAALTACGKKDETPVVVTPAPVVVTPPAAPAPAAAPDAAATPAPGASPSLDAANAATEAAKKNSETPPAKP